MENTKKKDLFCSEDFLALINAIPEGLIILNPDGIIVSTNPSADSFFGDCLTGLRWLSVIDNYFVPRADDGHEVSLKNGRRLKISITALAENEGELILLSDLTATRNLQDQISHLKCLSALGEMVSTLVHQIRTPLSAALLHASNLQNNDFSKQEHKKFSTKLTECLNNMDKQISSLLLFAKKDQLSFKKICLRRVLESSLDIVAPILSKNNCIFVKCFANTNFFIKGNFDLLASVFNNIFVNSVEAFASSIHISLVSTATSFSLSIDDNGCGFDESILKKIKEPFYTNKSKGTGLGLSIANKAMASHNGALELSHSDIFSAGAKLNLIFPKTYEDINE